MLYYTRLTGCKRDVSSSDIFHLYTNDSKANDVVGRAVDEWRIGTYKQIAKDFTNFFPGRTLAINESSIRPAGACALTHS